MKYVMIDFGGTETPIMFPEFLPHTMMAGRNIVSAGEFNIYGTDEPLPNACCCENAIRVSVFGESISLKVKSRPEDAEIIARTLMRHYH